MIQRLIITCIFAVGVGAMLSAQTPDEYLTTAAENNPGLKAKFTEFEAAMEKVAQVNTLPDPQLSFGVFILPVETRVGPQQAKIGLSQMFPWFGTLDAAGTVYQLKAEAKYEAFLQAKHDLYKKVKLAWYPLYEIEQQIRLQQENLEILKSYKQLATSAYESGKSSMTDVIRVDVMIDEAQTDIELKEDQRRPLLVQFNQLLNRDPLEEVAVLDTLKFPVVNQFYRKDSLFNEHPELKALDLKEKSAEEQARLARKKGMPKIGVGLDYVFVGQRNDVTIPDNGKDVLMPMVNVSIPIFRKKYDAAVKEAQLTREAVGYRREAFKNQLLSDYEKAWFDFERAQQMNELYARQVQKTEQMKTLLTKAYGNSGNDFEEVLRIQQRLLKYEMSSVTAVVDAYKALAKIDYFTSKTE